MSYTPKQQGSGAGGSSGGQNTQQKTLAQQMQDAVHNANALTQAISSSQGFSNMNMSPQQQQQTRQRLDLYMKQQQFLFSNPQIQQLQQQIQQHLQQQQNAAIEPLALTRGQNQQQQANGSTGTSMLANQQLQIQQAYANPANLMQQLQAYQFQMQQQQQQQQKMMPMNQAQQSLNSSFQNAQNAAAAQHFQQQQKLLAAAAAVQNKSMAALNQQKASLQMTNLSNVAQQVPSNNNLPSKNPAKVPASAQNFSKIPATIQPAKVPQTTPSPPIMKQPTSTLSSASKSSSVNVAGSVTITKSSLSPSKAPQLTPIPLTKSPSSTSSITITKSMVTSSSPSSSPSKLVTVNSSQSQSPKPAVTATTAAVINQAAVTGSAPKPSQPKEAPPKLEPKSETPSAAKVTPAPQPARNPEVDLSLSPPISSATALIDQNAEKQEVTPSIPTPADIPAPVPIPAPEKVPEENLPSVAVQKIPEAVIYDTTDMKIDSKVMEQEKVAVAEETVEGHDTTKLETVVPECAPVSEQSIPTASPKIIAKAKGATNQKKSPSPANLEANSSTNEGIKSTDKTKSVLSTQSPNDSQTSKDNQSSKEIHIPKDTQSPKDILAPKDSQVPNYSQASNDSQAPNDSQVQAVEPPVTNQQPPASTPSTPSAIDIGLAETSKLGSGRRSRRHRLKTIPFQSPLPELAYITKLSVAEATASSSPKQNEDKLTLFYKNEYLAVRNAEGGFFLCQSLQNVFRTSPKIRIRWLSEEKKDSDVYIPDFYDTTDIECVLTTVEMEKVNKDRWKIPKAEKSRIENILKKAIDVERGIAPRPVVTEENPDGLDISLYTNESQIERKRLEIKQKEEQKSIRVAAKREFLDRSKSKSPKKKRKTKSKKTSGVTASDLTESNDSEEEVDNDKEYKPKKGNIITQTKVTRAQRSPLAKARAASPIIIHKDSTPKAKSTIVPSKNLTGKKEDAHTSTPTSSASRSDRAKRRAIEDKATEPPAKKPAASPLASKRTPTKPSTSEKSQKSSDDELLIPLPEKKAPNNKPSGKTTNNKMSITMRSPQKSTPGPLTPTIDSPSKSTLGRTTRSRK